MTLIDLIRLLWNNIDHDKLKNMLESNNNHDMNEFMYEALDQILRDNLPYSKLKNLTYGEDSIDIDSKEIKTGGVYIQFIGIDLDINFYQDGCIIIFLCMQSFSLEVKKKIHINKTYLDFNEEYDESILTLTCGRDINLTLEEIYNYE